MRTWPATMGAGSAAASLWWTFWSDYLSAVFQPWWNQAHVPVAEDRDGLAVVGRARLSLDEDLEAWTLGDPANPAFAAAVGARGRTAPQVMRQAFATAVAHLSSELGGAPPNWAWGRLHSRAFPALSGAERPGVRAAAPRAATRSPRTPRTAG